MFHSVPPEVACLQGHLVIDNADDGILARLFALEYAGLFDVLNVGLTRIGLPVLLGGTRNHFRTEALRRSGGWDAWNVTEDADLAFRLVRDGYRIGDLPSSTLEEAPWTPVGWFRQRVRWMKGFAQTLVTHTRQPMAFLKGAGLGPGMTLYALCAGTLVSALGYPLFLATSLASFIRHGMPQADSPVLLVMVTLWLTLFMSGIVAMLAPLVLGARRRNLGDLLVWLPLMPLYYLLVSAAAWAALVEYVRAPSRWNKTVHGLALTSRAARPATPRSGLRGGLAPVMATRQVPEAKPGSARGD
jgi:glycosyltransferase XagB